MSRNNNGKVRATTHRGRSGRSGVYNPRHNDRNFDVRGSEHIDGAKSTKNVYWHCFQKTKPEYTFEDAEKKFYEDFFSSVLEAKNNRYLKSRHKEKVQTMEQFRHTERYAPEEIIFQLGNRNQEHRPSSKVLWDVINDYRKWQFSLWKDKADKVRIQTLDVALHRDEPQAADHVHERQVYMVKDDNGNWVPNQEQALKLLGIEADPTRKVGRLNNRKKVFSEMCRSKFIEIAKSHGVDIETQPREPGQSGLDLMEFKVKKLQEEIEISESKLNSIVEKIDAIERDTWLRIIHPDIWDEVNERVQATKKVKPFDPQKVSKTNGKGKSLPDVGNDFFLK